MFGTAFEQASAAGGKQRVATEKNGLLPRAQRTVIGDVPGGVARYIQHLQCQVHPGQADFVPFGHGPVTGGKLFGCRAVYGGLRACFEFCHAAHMVVVVVCQQNSV